MARPGVRRLIFVATLAAVVAVFPTVQAQSPLRDTVPSPAPGGARDWSHDVPAVLWAVDGAASLERDGHSEPAQENSPLLAGDRLRTDRGRVEVLFDDGSALDVDEFTRVDLQSDSLIRLLDGRVRLTIARSTSTLDYRIDTPAGSVFVETAGEYRIGIRGGGSADPELQVAVLRGSAEIENAYGRTSVRTGMEVLARDRRPPSVPYAFNVAMADAFDRWVESIHAERLGTQSTRYLPQEINYYSGVFDSNGSWDYLPSYGGYVWYPRVAVGWRPYSVGNWSVYGNFGWFWVGAGRWAYPTHHYGRWGLAANRWYWVPNHSWAPAWVSWGGAPGYVSWCPLGYNGYPVVGFSAGVGGGRYVDPWSAWTVVPSRVFVPYVPVSRYAVNYTSIAPGVRSQFSVRQGAPVSPVVSSARVQALRAPTVGRAVSRSGVSSVSRSANGGSFDRAVPGGERATQTFDPGASRTRTRIPQQDSSPARVDTPRIATPRVDSPRIESPRAVSPRTVDVPSAGSAPSRVYQSRQPLAPRDDSPRTEPPSRVYRSRQPDAAQPPPASPGPSRSGFSESRRSAPDREPAGPPPDRASDRGAVSRQPERSAPAPHIESRQPGSPPPSRGGSDNGQSSSRSSSGQGQGQAVRRGGER